MGGFTSGAVRTCMHFVRVVPWRWSQTQTVAPSLPECPDYVRYFILRHHGFVLNGRVSS